MEAHPGAMSAGRVSSNAVPELVSRYVKAVLPGPPGAAARVRVTQTGEMRLKPGGRALRFDAVEEFAVDRTAFAWRARFLRGWPLPLRVTDAYEPPVGRLEVRLFGLPVQRKVGLELARAEAMRYLAEIAWVPHAILANPQLQWRQLNAGRAEVSAEVLGRRAAVQLVFRGNEIVQTIAERPRLEAGGTPTRWVGEYGEYRSFNGIRMPARGEVRWELPEGPFTYWLGTITSAETIADADEAEA